MTQSEQSWEDYFADKISEGLTTGRIVLPFAVIEWIATDECLEGCRIYPGIGEIHQMYCPVIPILRSMASEQPQG